MTDDTLYEYLYSETYDRWRVRHTLPVRLPSWIRIRIERTKNNGPHGEDTKQLFVLSKIHKKRIGQVGPSYSADFSDTEIIKDLSATISSRYL